jgi:hypothetical protein
MSHYAMEHEKMAAEKCFGPASVKKMIKGMEEARERTQKLEKIEHILCMHVAR